MELVNQIAVITGGASGLGLACAELLAEKGVKLALLDRDERALSEIANKLDALPLVTDVTDEQAVENAFNELEKNLGNASICINCAGVAPAKRIVGRDGAMPLSAFSQVININLIGSFNVMRLAAHKMSLQQPCNADEERGVIINTASVAAFEGQIGQAAYSASKGGIVGLTLPAARELARFGIRVMAIAPGIFATPMMSAMPDEVQESLAAMVPFPKRLGKATEYAQTVQQIIENPMLNGSVIRLDGAIRMGAA